MKENYSRPQEYISSIYINGKCYKRHVKTLISFSKDPYLYPQIVIFLKSKEAYLELSAFFRIDISAKSRNMTGKLISEVNTIGGHYINPNELFYDEYRYQSTIEIGFNELLVRTYTSVQFDKSSVEFNLVNLDFPLGFSTLSGNDLTDSRKFKSYFNDISVIDDAVLSFDTRDFFSEIAEETFRRFKKKILRISYSDKKTNLKRIEKFLRHLLPYLSFLSGSNVTYNHVSLTEKGRPFIIQRFRRVTFDTSVSLRENWDDKIIDRSKYAQFLSNSINKFLTQKIPPIDSIYQFNYSNSNMISKQSFLILFMSLEALVTSYTNIYRREYTYFLVKRYPNKNKKKQSNYFKKVIDRQRIEFKNKCELFIYKSGIDVNDLWPLYGSNSFLTLSKIRNKIAHEGYIKDNKNLWYAQSHLQWIYLRFFLHMVGWNDKHKLTPSALKRFIPYNEWRANLICQ